MFNYKLMSENVNEMNMTQLSHNQFFIKDGEAWYRDFEREISCRDLVREIALKQNIWNNDSIEITDQEHFDDSMLDNLQYGTEEPEGVLSMYYSAMWNMAEIRMWYIELKQTYNRKSNQELSKQMVKPKGLTSENINKIIEMINYDGEPVPKELCTANIKLIRRLPGNKAL